jgi:hypothetical protein
LPKNVENLAFITQEKYPFADPWRESPLIVIITLTARCNCGLTCRVPNATAGNKTAQLSGLLGLKVGQESQGAMATPKNEASVQSPTQVSTFSAFISAEKTFRIKFYPQMTNIRPK